MVGSIMSLHYEFKKMHLFINKLNVACVYVS